ncbi:MAG: hypothetical protein ACM30G_06665 [Micromonosporaceae bacterium]
MTTPQGPADKLVALLETLPEEERREITAFLLDRSRPAAPSSIGLTLPHMMIARIGDRPPEAERIRRLASALPAGEDSQLITIRLPAERHAELRTWCGEHGFTMAAVVRGLVERFLEEHASGRGTT